MKNVLTALVFGLFAFTFTATAQTPTYDYAWIKGRIGDSVLIVSTASDHREVEGTHSGGGQFVEAVRATMVVVQEFETQGWELVEVQIQEGLSAGIWIMRKPKP